MQNNRSIARKREIRKQIRQLRDSMSEDEMDSKSSAVESSLWRLIHERQAESIMFYISFGSEVRTENSINRAIGSGKTAIVPLCCPDEERKLLPCHLLDLQSEVEEGTFCVLEPKSEFRRPFPPEKIDLVVVPGLAFDERGYRIGYGAGYYDHFLPKCSQALFVGLAYEMQIIECAFPLAWDVPIHKIITENRVISCCSKQLYVDRRITNRV